MKMKRNNLRALVPILLVLLTLVATMQSAFAQTVRTIKGIVTDEKAEPLPGASVKVKGTSASSTANVNGQFTINVPENGKVLVVAFVGMVSQEITIGNKTTINVMLRMSSTTLNDIVVVGYGQAKRANLTSAQASISSKELNRTVNTTIEQAIQGRAAGVYVTQNSGQPGGGISVNIRGISTVNGTTQPLWVIDGVQIQQSTDVSSGNTSSSNPLAGINPSDIADVQVLSGPSATAIYGSRATNGVVLVTTKRGKAGDMRIGYNFKTSVQTTPNSLNVMNLREYAQMVKEFHAVAGGETPLEFRDPSLLGNGTDWQKELFNNAPMQNHNVTLSGGTEKTTYYLAGDYLNQKGVSAGSGFNRYSFRLNLDNKPKSWIAFASNIQLSQIKENLTGTQENVIANALQLTPQVPVKNIDGSWGGANETNGANLFAPVNPIAIANLTTNNNTKRELQGGLNATVDLLKGLKFKTSFSTNINYSNSTYFIPAYKIGWAENVSATLQAGANTSTYWNFNQLLEYNRQFGKHNIGLMASHESQESMWKNSTSSRKGFLTNDILDIKAGDGLTASNTGGSSPWGMESYFGRLNYNYKDKYIITSAVRADGSTSFGSDNKWGVFPSISAARRISGEEFFKVPAISDLKLRVETGITGNQGYGYGFLSPLEASTTPTGTGFLVQSYSNPGLKWEETSTNNIGINIGFLKDRFQIEADYYDKKTKNLLMNAPLADYMGSAGAGAIAAPLINLGSMTNKGWSVSFNSTNIQTRNFKWSSNLNVSKNRTKITEFSTDASFVDRTSWWLDNWTQRSAVGQAPWLFRGYIEEGLFQSIDEINDSAVPVDNNGVPLATDPTTGVWVGDVKYKDISGPNGAPDGIIDVNDLTNIGNPWPKMFGGFSNSFSYKGFDLSVLITGTFGNDVYNYIGRVATDPNRINLSRNLLVHAIDYAKPVSDGTGGATLANPGTDVARISYGPNGNYTRLTNKWVEDGSFVRLKNISLTYNLPAALVAKQKFARGARIGFSAQNILTITGYKGYDPEVGSYVGRDVYGGNQAIGLDYGRYPLTAVYSFSLGVDF